MTTILTGKQVLEHEAYALLDLAKSLDVSFAISVELIKKTINNNGRIILTGMGKSSHIARKISATFSSTGIPSYFIHPAEASHGDLGMILKKDCVIIISNSGETTELKDLLHYCLINKIPIITITSNQNSTIANASTICMIFPPFKEACPFGLVPTTSTTLSLALGDALAVAIYKDLNFSEYDFKIYHPGGKLGAQLLLINQLMHRNKELPIVYKNTIIQDVIVEISSKCLGCAIVMDGNKKILGIVTDGDLRRYLGKIDISKSVETIMTKNPITINENLFAIEALNLMKEKSITSLIVDNNQNQLVGLLHIHDCLRIFK